MINSTNGFIKGSEGKDVFLRIWDDVEYPIGIVQVLHGMAEHSARYNDFAQFLNNKGYIVYADDHRGHGYSIAAGEVLGYIGDDGFNNIVEDERIISKLIKKEYKELPLYIFAHSFGSFIGQEYIIRYSKEIDGIILSGSAKQDGIDVKAGRILASIQNRFFDSSSEAKLIDKLSFGSYNKKVGDQNTKFDWLSQDNEQVKEYMEDKFCGFISPINFYYHIFKAFEELYKVDRLKTISKSLPILVLSGGMDPVGKYGRSVKRLYNQYKDLDMENLTLKLFEGGRHELLNEINREEVFEFVYDWLSSPVPKVSI